MKRNWRLLVLGVALAGAVCGVVISRRSERPDNLLLITLDTTRADRLACYGYPHVETPVLDALAAQGCVFERAYTPVPLTLPSHASLMTGLYPPEHGIRVNSGEHRLGSDIPVLSERLNRQGYRTGAFVGGFVLDHKFGLDRGFEVYDDLMEESRNPFMGDAHGHKVRSGQRVVDAALKWLEGRRQQPFFCWVHLFDPHTPYSAREELFGERYRDRPYDAGIAYVDRQVGRLMDFLRRKGLYGRTIVVVIGDHGESLGEHQERTHGFTLYNSTLHVPLIMRWAGENAPVRRISTPVSLVDVFPTLNAVLNPGDPLACSGRSLWPACTGEALSPETHYAESDHPLEEGAAAPVRSLATDRWKYIRSPRPELYDLVEDPQEEQNVAERHPEKIIEFEQGLQEREAGFLRRDAASVLISPSEKRKLASLGYTGGGEADSKNPLDLPDIKDMLLHFNALSDAQLFMGEQKFHKAKTILEQLVTAVPDYFQAWFSLGVCHHELGDSASAVSAFERSIEIHENAVSQMALSKVFLSQNQPEKAIPHLERAVRSDPESAEGPFLLGMAYRMQGKIMEARRYFEQALEVDGDFSPARHELLQLP